MGLGMTSEQMGTHLGLAASNCGTGIVLEATKGLNRLNPRKFLNALNQIRVWGLGYRARVVKDYG